MTSLAWLNELMTWLGKWFPRIVLVKAAHLGVKFGRAGRVSEMTPGLYCYWPITTEVTIVSVRRRTSEIACQLIDQEALSLVTAFTITDPRTALLQFNDLFSQLDDRTQAHLTRAYVAADANHQICARILAGLRDEFEPHGVAIHTVDVIQRGWVFPLKNLNDWAQHAKAEL